MDVASLGFTIDSSQATTATERLDRLHASARSLSQSTQSLSITSNDLRSALTQLANQVQLNNAAFQQTATNLDAVLTKLEQTRQRIGESTSAFAAFITVQQQADALGRSVGVSGVALEAFEQQSRRLGMTAEQTAQSLQRITMALENQTQMGRQVRQVMQDYGVSLEGLGANDAGKALERFITQMRTFRDDSARFQTSQMVMGPGLNTDVYGRMGSPSYEPIVQRQLRQDQLAFNERVAFTAQEAARLQQENAAQQAKYDDLSSNYRLNYRRGMGLGGAYAGSSSNFLSDEDRGRIARDLGPGSAANIAPNSMAGQIAMMQWMADHPNDPASLNARTWSRWGGDVWRGTGIPRWMDFQTNGGFDSARRLLVEQAASASANRGDLSRANVRALGADTLLGVSDNMLPINPFQSAVFGLGARFFLNPSDLLSKDGRTDLRPMSPIGAMSSDLAASQDMMRTFGDQTMYAQLLNRLRLNAMTGERGNDTLDLLQRQYNDRVTGRQVFNMRREETNAMQRQLLLPGGPEMAQLVGSEWALSQGWQNAGDARMMESFLRSMNIQNPGYLLQTAKGGPISLEALLNGGEGNPIGLSPQMLQAFGNYRGRQVGITDMQASQDMSMFMNGQTTLRGMDGSQSGAYAAEAAAIQARNAALQQGQTLAQAEIQANTARRKSVEDATTALLREIDVENDRLNRAEFRAAALESVGGDSLTAAATNRYFDIQDQVAAAEARRPGSGEARRMQLQRQAGIEARVSSEANVTSAATELRNAERMLQVSGERAGLQDKMRRDIEVERQFEASLAAARQTNDEQQIRAIQQKIDLVKEMRDQVAEVNREAALFKLGQDAERDTAFINYRMSLPPSQRFRADAQRPFINDQYDNGGQGMGGLAGADYGLPGGVGISSGRLPNWQGTDFGPAIQRAAASAGVDPRVLQWLLGRESGFNPYVVGPHTSYGRAMGMGQFMPGTAQGVGLSDPFDPYQSIEASARYLRQRLDQAGGSYEGAVKGYGTFSTGRGEAADAEVIRDFRRMIAGGAIPPAIAPNTLQAYAALPGVSQGAFSGSVLVDENALARQRAARREGAEQSEIATRGQIGIAGSTLLGPGPAMEARIRMQVEQEQSQGRIPDGREGERASELRLAEMAQLLNQINSGTAGAGLGIRSNQAISQAYLTGGTAAGELASRMDPQTLNMQALVQHFQSLRVSTDGERQALEQLVPAMQRRVSLLQSEIDASANVRRDAGTAALADQNSDLRARTSLGIGWGPQFERAQLEAEIANQRARTPEGQLSSFNRNASERLSQFDARQQAQEVQQLSQTFQQMGMAAGTAFTNAIISGQRFSTVIQTLIADLARMAAQRFILQPIMNFLGGPSMLGGLFGGGKGGEIVSSISEASAAGNVFVGGHVVPFAGGGVVDRPTFFPMASGGTGLMGEGGKPEAVMPLMRLPNGNLGVQSTGGMGGSGHQVMVHAPITVHGGVQGDGKMDPSALKQMQEQMEGHLNAVFRSMLDNEMRPGGRLY